MVKVQRLDRSCYPCAAGDHRRCRHHPDKEPYVEHVRQEDGTWKWVKWGDRFKTEEVSRGPCQCEKGGHVGDPGTCNAFVLSDYSDSRCSKPAKGVMPQTKFTTIWDKDAPMVEVCGIHLSGYRRRIENDLLRKERYEAEDKRRDDVKSANRASEDWAQKLRDEFGLPVDALSGTLDIRCAISPEKVYGILDEIRLMLDEVYDDHPFKRGLE